MNSITVAGSAVGLSSIGPFAGSTTTSNGTALPDIPVGICGLCAGKVTIPSLTCGSYAPIPTCSKCGATERPKPSCLPVLDMVDPKETYWGTG